MEENKIMSNKRLVRFRQNHQVSYQKIFNRRFHNPDLATCWLNSCLQLLLLAMDYDEEKTHYYSELGRELVNLRTQSTGRGLDPTIVKDILVSTEDTRIATRLSELPNEVEDEVELERLTEATHNSRLNLTQGQQCVRDFFVCLSQNEDSWPDVLSIISFDMTGSTTCGYCQSSSQSQSTHSFYELPVPQNRINLATFLEDLLSNGTEVKNSCTKCKKKSMGIHRKTLTDVSKTKFIVLLFSRVLETVDGYELIQNKVDPTGNMILR